MSRMVFIVIHSSIGAGDSVIAVHANAIDAVANIDNLKPDWTIATPDRLCGGMWLAARISPNKCGSLRVEQWEVQGIPAERPS
jgi:hypothetical protein